MTEVTNEALEEFCWSVIFVLRQPMTAISGQVQRARRLLYTDPLRAREAMDEAVEQIARLDQLLAELYERELTDTRRAGARRTTSGKPPRT
jgi:hypothetical protein